ncbi:hypothetical protein [Paraburkholderia terricola]|uniref:hypothetical protein n=1 Tax=Paraburkholderia terricola TaxID=169427 RepID=UPI000DEFDDCD|nr:hypothetical protein [Paraburkholderia terricola]AXE92841.1 hypothetical protein CUJ90_11225 [Paraburkholderia terricola]
MSVTFFICTKNAIGKTHVVVKDKNNGMQIILNEDIPQDDCREVTANGDASDEANIEYSLNGGSSYGHPYIKSGERVNVF